MYNKLTETMECRARGFELLRCAGEREEVRLRWRLKELRRRVGVVGHLDFRLWTPPLLNSHLLHYPFSFATINPPLIFLSLSTLHHNSLSLFLLCSYSVLTLFLLCSSLYSVFSPSSSIPQPIPQISVLKLSIFLRQELGRFLCSCRSQFEERENPILVRIKTEYCNCYWDDEPECGNFQLGIRHQHVHHRRCL